ncbi:MAG: hypothetical protein JNK64_13330 [Myxococcales bacterium]|nr:hypothetical protein [Myxococcales bacterium]
MLKLLALALTLAACPHRTAPPPRAAAAPGPTAAPAPTPTPATHFAAVELSQTWSECSNAGGEHAAFAIGGSRMHVLRMAHAGGHAEYYEFGGRSFSPPGPRAASGWFVAELIVAPRVDEDHDDNPDSGLAGWCLDGMPRFVAEVVRLWPAADEAEARRLAAAPPTTPPAYASPWAARP